MILVDVYVPLLDKTYDFRLAENARIEDVTEEIAEVICQYEHCKLSGSAADLILCQDSRHCILASGSTLAQNGVGTGDRLSLL